MRPIVGLVVNPGASRDIRRLTSLARTVDVHERVNQVARILQGVGAAARLVGAGPVTVLYMPESCRVVERATEEIARAGLAGAGPGSGHENQVAVRPVLPPDMPADDADGTTRAATALARAGTACVVTIGGDGTNRAVASGWPDAVVCAVPGGTNNAFARPLDPVAAGLAAGLFAADPASCAAHAHLRPRLVVRWHPAPGDAFAGSFALVDVAVVRGAWVGAHAVWDPATLVEAVVTRADPTVSGLAGLAGMIRPVHVADDPGASPRGVHLRFGAGPGEAAPSAGTPDAPAPGQVVLAPLGPGQLVPVVVRSWRELAVDEAVRLGPYEATVTLAFDGEREIVIEPGGAVEVRLARSPLRHLDAAGLLRDLSERGALALPSREA